MKWVLDASALLAYLHQEPGWERVQPVIAGAGISTVNWSEVAQKARRLGLDVQRIRSFLQDMDLSIVEFSLEHAEFAAALWEQTHSLGLSLSDRACLALGMQRQLPILTADRAWAELSLNLDIQLIR